MKSALFFVEVMMDDYDKGYIEGTCITMCPEDEIKMREKEGLLHILEILPGTEKQRKPKAHKEKMVKAYIRSAVGQDNQNASNLRTSDALLKTVNYLLDLIISSDKLPWYKIYDFIADRLLAVRQDMIVQNLEKPYVISLLQPIVRFYAYSAYRLCEEDNSRYDPVLNNKQLQDCLKKLLVCYDYYDILHNIASKNKFFINCNLFEYERSYFEALYLLFNLGNSEAITRGLNLSKHWRTKIVQIAININLNYVKNNWIRVCRLISKLPSLLIAVASLHLPMIRRKGLEVMNTACSSKNLTYALNVLYPLFLYDTKMDLIKDCKLYNIRCDQTYVYFVKGTMNNSVKVAQPKKSKIVNNKLLEKSIVALVLNGDIE